MKLTYTDLEKDIEYYLLMGKLVPFSKLQRKYNCSLSHILRVRKEVMERIEAS